MAYTTIDDPSAYFKVQLYTGDGNNNRTITFDDTDTDMQPDMIWIKERSSTSSHYLTSVGLGIGTRLEPDANSLQTTEGLSAVTSNGFTIGTSTNQVNQNTITHVAWCWKESATAGFDIVTATGNATAKTISHSLSAVPHWMIAKEKTGSVNDWTVYHHKNTSAPETDSLILNETNATSDNNTHWNDTAPTSSVFTVGTGSVVNRNSSTYVYYLWSEKKGFSKFGSYTGNGNADGTFVYTGFKPAFIIAKETGNTNAWYMFDSKRSSYNGEGARLMVNASDAEVTNNNFDILSNGFKNRLSGTGTNRSGGTYLYMAIAESPFVNSNGVPTNAR